MTKTFKVILLIIIIFSYSNAQELDTNTDSIYAIEQSLPNNSQGEDKMQPQEKIPLPTPLWQWLLIGIFAASTFGMVLNKRIAGYIIFGAICFIVFKKLQIALENDFSLTPFYILGGWVLITSGMAKKANARIISKSKISGKSDPATRLINQAYDEIDRKNYEKAKVLIEESFKIDNSIPEAHSEYAFVMSILGHIDMAIDHMIKAALLKPNEAKFWTNLAFQYYNDKQYIKALTSTLVAELVDSSYPSIAQSKQMIAQEFPGYQQNVEKCKDRAKEILTVLNKSADSLPPQSGDINHCLNPDNKFSL